MKKKSMTLLIVALAIGFASISTTLVLNGTIGIGTNNDNFVDGVVFDSESLSSSEGTTAEISESGRTITFTTQEMKTVNETAIVNFKIKNYSQYNATLGTPAISCYFVDDYEVDTKATKISDTHEYMKIIPGSNLDGTTIVSGGGLSDESNVTVKQIKSYTGDTQAIKFQCEINASASDSEIPSIEKTEKTSGTYELTNDVNNNGVADIGDEIQVGTESFYVISTTDAELNALAKYNLKVGGIYTSSGTLESTIESTEEGYGRQDPQMRGYVSGEKRYGTVAFSNNNGWPYENNDTIDIKQYDGPVNTALYGENGYEKYIQETIPSASVRLITKSELEALGCDSSNYSCKVTGVPEWVYSTSYWTQSADSNVDISVLFVNSLGDFGVNFFDDDGGYGVRPVVEIPLT